MVKCEALLAGGKSAEALAESRSLTIQGDAKAPEVLTFRAQALYLTGACTRRFQLLPYSCRSHCTAHDMVSPIALVSGLIKFQIPLGPGQKVDH